MDRICNAILDKILSLAPAGRYVIIAEDEFLESFPEDGDKSDTELKKSLKNLVNAGYIDVKYSSGNLYCVAPLKRYVPEEVSCAPAEDKPAQRKKTLSPFWAAFAGGAAGSLLISLVFALISYAG